MRRGSFWGVLAAIVIGAAAVASSSILGKAVVRAKGTDEMIRVTGSARKDIDSDLIIWSGTVSHSELTVPAAFNKLKSSVAAAVTYLRNAGVDPDEIRTQAITTETLTETVRTPDGAGGSVENQRTSGYRLAQRIEIRSKDVTKIDKISREITDLIAKGVPFQSEVPQYLYTKIADEKVAILREAAKDARERAVQIAKSSGATLDDVRFARMSPLQITARYDTGIEGGGQNDTTSREKAITAIVTLGIGLK